MAGSRRTAARVTLGAICLSSSSHFALMLYSKVWRERGQFRSIFANIVGIAPAPAIVDPHVAAVGPAQLPQPLQKRREACLSFCIVLDARECADAAHAFRLLSVRSKRPSRRPADKRDELPPPHAPSF